MDERKKRPKNAVVLKLFCCCFGCCCRIIRVYYIHFKTILMRSTVHAAFMECRLCAQKAKNHVLFTSIRCSTATETLGFWIYTYIWRLCYWMVWADCAYTHAHTHIKKILLWIVYYHNYDALKVGFQRYWTMLVCHNSNNQQQNHRHQPNRKLVLSGCKNQRVSENARVRECRDKKKKKK